MFGKESKWVCCHEKYSAPIVIKRFKIDELEKAIIDISGLGYYELFINDKRVGTEYFKPVVSDYCDRDFSDWLYPLSDRTSHTVYYNTFDVTEFLRTGENTIAIMLGNGFFRQKKRDIEGKTWFGEKLLLRYELRILHEGKKQLILSDGQERVTESFIRENNLFFGEMHDYTGFVDFSFTKIDLDVLPFVEIQSNFKTCIRKQHCPNDKIVEVIAPKLIRRTENSSIYDVGINLTGFVRFKALSDFVKIRHSENCDENGLNFNSTGGKEQISENIYRNACGRKVHPWFSWSGFRYFEVFGEVSDLEVCFVHTDLKINIDFESGNQTLNWFFKAYLNTQLCNMHGGVPSDCPHRERLGYTGDGQLTAESAMLCLDSKKFYEKWTQDIADCQDKRDGHVQHTAPFFGGGGGPGGWGSAIVIVPYAYYKIYGDKKLIKRYYSNMLAYLSAMKGFSEDGLIVREREKGWCLGDWCTPEKVEIPEPFINTFYYIRCMKLVEEIAWILGYSVDLQSDIQESEKALVARYFDERSNDFCQGIQGANAFALLLGLGNEKTKENLLAHYKQLKHFDTGIFGTDVLTEYLVQIGEIQFLYDLLTADGYPSFGYMRENGATTLWETWDGKESHNHPMFGGCAKQILYGLLGMKFDAGFKNLSFKPKYIEGIGYIKATLRTPQGKELKIEYTYKNGQIHSNIV